MPKANEDDVHYEMDGDGAEIGDDLPLVNAPGAAENPFSDKSKNTKQAITPLPWKTIGVLACVMISEAMTSNVIFPFVGFMVKGFRIAESDAVIGYYAGFLAASYFLAQFFCSFFYGWLSDRIGRRPVLLFGLFNVVLCTVLFCFSPNIWWAILARLLTGLLNGNVGVAKTYIAEITDETNQSAGFGVLSTVWNIGNVIGPAVGGILAKPADSWPTLFPRGSFFDVYEFALPCMAVASIAALGLLAGIFFLPEPDHTRKPGAPYAQVGAEMTATLTASDLESSGGSSSRLISRTDSMSSITTSIEDFSAFSKDVSSPVLLFMWRIYHWLRRLKMVRLMRRRKVLVSVLLYTFLGFADVAFEEAFPLWSLVSAKEGGLGFTTTQIGGTVSFGSAVLLGFQLYIFPKIERVLGPIQCFRWGYYFAIPAITLFPLVHYLTPFPQWVLYVGVCLAVLVYYISISLVYLAVFILIANSAERNNLGSVNGIAQSTVAFMRALAPVIGGTLLAWSLSHGYSFPLNFFFVFLVMGACHALNLLLSFQLPASSNNRE